jgi:hypothetical protein
MLLHPILSVTIEHHITPTVVVGTVGKKSSANVNYLMQGAKAKVSINLQEFVDTNTFCNNVPGQVNIYDQVSPNSALVDSSCGTPTGCDVNIVSSANQSYVTHNVTGGEPKDYGDFMWPITFSYKWSSNYYSIQVPLSVKVAVVGTVVLQNYYTVPILKKVPMFILRDPPGDSSSSTWTTDSTLTTNVGLSSKFGNTNNFGSSFYAGYEGEHSLCIFGFCEEVLSIESKVTSSFEVSLGFEASYSASSEFSVSFGQSQSLLLWHFNARLMSFANSVGLAFSSYWTLILTKLLE